MKKHLFLKNLMVALLLLMGMSASADVITKTINAVVSENGYTVSSGSTINTKCYSIDLDDQINVSITRKAGATGNTGSFWGTTTIDWRLYQLDEPTITVTAATGYEITSVKFTYTVSNNGIINISGHGKNIATADQVPSNQVYSVNAASAVFYVGNTSTKTNGQARITSIEVVYASTSPLAVTAPIFDVTAGTYTEDQLVLIDNYDNNYLYAYTTDGTNPAFNANLDVTNGTLYDENEGIEVTSSCTIKAIAVDEDGNTSSITSVAYVINKPQVFASLEELVAADLASGSMVTVSFEDVAVKDIYVTKAGYRNGIYFDIQKDDHDIEIYYQNVPEEWVAGGTVSGTMTCPWTYYAQGTTWELAPANGTWDWSNLTYTYVRETTAGNFGTICLPTATSATTGATFYNIAGVTKDASNEIVGIVLTEETGALVAGKPYIFKATAATLTATFTGDAVAEPIAATGLVGNFDAEDANVPQGSYVVSANTLRQVAEGGAATVGQYKAYINLAGVAEYAAAPERATVLPVVGNNPVATDIENAAAIKATKALVNGNIVIVRNGAKFNINGMLVK